MSDLKGQPVVKTPSRNTADSDATKLLRVTRDGMLLANYLDNLGLQGRLFYASDADENDTVTGATSYAATTPLFVLDVPSGTTCIPLSINLRQAGTVAGGIITTTIAIETAKVRYSSGGTAETNIISTRTDKPVSPRCTLYSLPTAAAAGTACAIFHDIVAPDVAPASADAARFTVDWPAAGHLYLPKFLVGPASFLVFSYAATTGPTYQWALAWGEIPSSDLT